MLKLLRIHEKTERCLKMVSLAESRANVTYTPTFFHLNKECMHFGLSKCTRIAQTEFWSTNFEDIHDIDVVIDSQRILRGLNENVTYERGSSRK
jgi:hypothetical protein